MRRKRKLPPSANSRNQKRMNPPLALFFFHNITMKEISTVTSHRFVFTCHVPYWPFYVSFLPYTVLAISR